MKLIFTSYLLLALLYVNISFSQNKMGFEVVTAENSGINFKNSLTEVDTFNYLNFQYMYNGGGVAVGDINNDGLSDLYFTGNQVADKLYLNKGNLKFEDITKKSIGNLADKGWHTGVTMADVNGDGFLDIYVCRSGLETFKGLRSNLLYINNGDNTFSEKSKEFGVNVAKGSVQAAFVDIDNDGDLDLYVMNRPYEPKPGEIYDSSKYPDSDDLLENRDGKFVNISEKAGIKNRAFGLGIAISDINRDGYQDIYISNDYVQPDFCYINQGNNSFTEEIKTRTRHVSHFGMGNDIADFNNDGLLDIMTVDMATADHIKSKKTMSGMNPQQFWNSIESGNQYEYMFNTLQLNNGDGTYSEIAQLAGVSKTDWSWGPLFADFDNDGYKDLFVSNGYRREVRDNDYVIRLRTMDYDVSDFEEVLGLAIETKIENEIYKNIGGLKFEKTTADWNIDYPINSNGAAYADLDNDGDLDLILNNMEDVSTILENKLESENHYLRVTADKHFDGAQVTVTAGGQKFYQEYYRSRGYQSCTEGILHFGLGSSDKVSEIKIRFRNGKEYKLADVEADQTIKMSYEKATVKSFFGTIGKALFTELQLIDYKHSEDRMNDFIREVLLPHRMSELGPFISAGDVNGDKLTDFYISGSRRYAGALFMQLDEGGFRMTSGPWEKEKEREEQGSEFFDCDGDGDLDLYISNGGNEYIFYSGQLKEEEYNLNLQDQLYINDGKGNFTNETTQRLPKMITSVQRISTGDIDDDGDLDIFVGGRQIPGFYPFSPLSYLLQNDGKGNFTDLTKNSPDINAPGLVTESIFDDFDQDGDLDLIMVGEWMAPSFFENRAGIFTNVTSRFGLENQIGWWMSIEKGDFNSDGRNDYVLGNIGENNKFHPSAEKPMEIFVRDFDNNGSYDIVLGKYQAGICYPVRGRQCSSEQMPFITQKFPTYDEFANANLSKIYGKDQLDSALHYSATEFSSCILLSSGERYELQHLPIEAQLGPINSIEVFDFNNDGFLDILGVGNNYGAEIETVRYDGGRGVLLLGDGKGGFVSKSPNESGFSVNTDAKDMVMVDGLIVVVSNNDLLKTFIWTR